MDARLKSIKTQKELGRALQGSYYFIAGCGGDLTEWIDGYEKLLKKEGIGKPKQWYVTSGAAVNRFAGSGLDERNYFKEDLSILMFPLDGLDGRLAIFKLQMEDRWFDDVIQNMRGDNH